MVEKKSVKKPLKRSFWGRLVDKVDKKMEELSCSGGCCSGGSKKSGKCC